jgi:hypothetical protein
MARTVLPLVGAAVGFWVGGPTGAQIGFAAGSIIGGAVDPVKIQGPRLGETGAQTSAEGAPRAIIYGTISCTGNVIAAGPLVLQEVETSEGKGSGPVTSTEHGYRTYAIRICEGPVGGILRIWEDDKLVYDIRTGSGMLAESARWIAGCTIYLGTEDQLPDPNLETEINSDMPAYRGTCYMVFSQRDLTDRRGSIPQYRFEVAKSVEDPVVNDLTAQASVPVYSPLGVPEHQYVHLNYMHPANPNYLTNAFVGSILTNAVTKDGSVPYKLYDFDESCAIVSTADVVMIPGSFSSASPTPTSDFFTHGYYGQLAVIQGTNYENGTQLYLTSGGSLVSVLVPDSGALSYWYADNASNARLIQNYLWVTASAVYLGVPVRVNGSGTTNYNSVFMWPTVGGTAPDYRVNASATIFGVCATPGAAFMTHLGRDGKFRIINDVGVYSVYSASLVLESSETLPFSIGGIEGFGVDDDVAVFIRSTSDDGGPTSSMYVRSVADWALESTYANATFATKTVGTRVIFTDDSVFIQCNETLLRSEYEQSSVGAPAILSEIVSDIHDRCKIDSSKFDVSELTDEVSGLLLAGDYTGADAINTLRAPYFFDKYEADKSLWYPKRGANAAFVIDIDDLVEEPDVNNRQQAIEYPKKMHLQYQHANSGYAVVKATSSRSSPDARVIGEAGMAVPVVLTENEAAQTVAKMHKVAWTEADGSIELGVPDSFIEFTPTDVGSVTLRGQTTRRRIVKSDYADGVIRWTLVKDRQSAYTSEVEGVPVPDPTPPPATITGSTVLAVLDISSRTDTEDDLNIYYGVTGAMPAWYGAVVQRSTDGGANYTNIVSINQASIIGYISGSVTDASEYFTDTTNVLTVTLYRDGQSLESITDQQFLSEGGAFALEKPDGSWEIMQYRDAELDTSGRFILSTLHRGLLNSGTSSHSDGALFVMLDRPVHMAMPSSLIGVDLTHRAPSFEQSPELASEQTAEYIGRSQIEWPIAYLELTRNGTDISATWTPRHRFGTDDAPVASINFQGYRVTIDGGSNGSVTFDTTTAGFTNYDASSLGGGLTVSVSSLNRITGAGPSTSDII